MPEPENVKIEDIKAETEDYYSDDDLYNINSWGADFSFRELITMYDEDELVKPELQRHYVWDKSEASRFIESLLLRLPVPSIFLAKSKHEKKLIVDGYQRIMTVYDYVQKGIFSKDKKVFKLSNSEKINKKWRNKSFAELTDDEQRRIKSTTIHSIIFEQRHPKDGDTSLYQVFERINTSGRTLLAQEIRNCVYQGIYNESLNKLNKYVNWRKLFGTEDIDYRMRDVEFILRFAALASEDIKHGKPRQISMKKFLNDYMDSANSKDPRVLKEREKTFLRTMDFIYTNIGIHAFHNLAKDSSKYTPRFHPTIFDAVSIATCFVLQASPELKPSDLEGKRKKLLQDDEFAELIYIRTTNTDRINRRISMACKQLYNIDYV